MLDLRSLTELQQYDMKMEHDQKVMIIEDNSVLRGLLQYALDPFGFRLIVCQNGAEALLCKELRGFDYIITDYNMPGMNGLELTHWFRERVPLSIIIGMSGDDVGLDFLRAGANDFLQKPFAPYDLAMMINGSHILP